MKNQIRPEIAEWELLKNAWNTTRVALDEAELILDNQVVNYLEGTGDRPAQALIEKVAELRFLKQSARSQLAIFIAELP